MARAAVASALALCLLALAAAAPDFSQEEYQQRGNSEQQTQQQNRQVWEDRDGTLDRLRQADQQRGQLQQDQQWNQQIRGQQRGQIQQDQQQGQGIDRLVNGKPQVPVLSNTGSGSGIVADNWKPVQNPAPNPAQNPASNPRPQPPWRPPVGSVRPSQPPLGYTRLSNYGYFKAFTTPLTWPEALMTCFADGALLAVPGSEAEARAIGEFFGKVKNQVKNSADKSLFFIGASDIHKEGSFATILGTKFEPNGQWHRWAKGEPSDTKKRENCVQSNDKGFYWDGNCQVKLAFVCYSKFKDPCKNSPRSNQLQQSQDLQQQTQRRY